MALTIFSEITPLPERASGTKPDADGELWNTRYIEVNLNFELLEGGSAGEFWKAGGGWAVPSGTGSTNGHVIQDDGVSQTQRTNLNFTGNISASDNATETAIFVPSAFKNLLINGDFRINERDYVSAATLAAGTYAHDRWKAGSGGGDYSFTQLLAPTQITIAANKTLIQVVAPENVEGGTYVLSWEGTAQARYAVDSDTPTGSYASSPIIITGQTAGTTMSVEFGNGASAGTLGKAQLEPGSTRTNFEYLPEDIIKNRCVLYFERFMLVSASAMYAIGYISSTTLFRCLFAFSEKRTTPTISWSDPADFQVAHSATTDVTALLAYSTTKFNTAIRATVASGLTPGQAGALTGDAGATHYIDISAEL